MEYLNTIRLRNAASLLDDSDLALATIALRCGFYDSSHFCVCFKRAYGLPRHQYRLKQRSSTQES